MEKVRVFLKHDLAMFVIWSGRRKTDLVSDKVDKLTTLDAKCTTKKLLLLKILLGASVKLSKHALINQEKY